MSLDLDESKLQKEMNSMTLGLLTQREIWFQQIYWGVLPNIQEQIIPNLYKIFQRKQWKNTQIIS